MNNRLLGDLGESTASGYLRLEGYKILERNFRCKCGEIDIIAEKDGELVFVEVKTRSGDAFGSPAEAVGNEKLRHMRSVAQCYLLPRNMSERNIRFDVFEIGINHIEKVM